MSAWDEIRSVGSDFKRIMEVLTHTPTYIDAIKHLPQIVREDTGASVGYVPSVSTFEERFKEGLMQFVQKGKSNPEQVAMDFMPGAAGVIRSNFRTPQEIQMLRKIIAEEMRSRGPVATTPAGPLVQVGSQLERPYSQFSRERVDAMPFFAQLRGSERIDPIDQILRGSWYHGMGTQERLRVSPDLIDRANLYRTLGKLPGESELDLIGAYRYGFPISHHDAQSMSNRLGEPSGVSLTMLPTKAMEFAADREFIHRVLPMYGGSPTERVVNLMTPHGRKSLNEAYDVVFNSYLRKETPAGGHTFLEHFSDLINMARPSRFESHPVVENIISTMENRLGGSTAQFNQGLSNRLQSEGYRGILYNPKRWDEYEMLMLDPKYVQPLDYRKFQEYGHPSAVRNKPAPGNLDVYTATPGVKKGLDQILDLMSQNASRLGDIYSERPWVQRLSTENKDRLLELINPEFREMVGNQLYAR